ncbi:pre-rRNA processing protein-like protein Utp22 [Lophium mytilinum]|uniref:U3 small nucleolar RNA-associated protein 22 n=1 Tax=Lophium mytilinum TaxID=390894 RepID=A0A6A6R5M8_9PEZI|nr:pre-rRNA processing protein-like protein Utp22 [Lophium mytilinum]
MAPPATKRRKLSHSDSSEDEDTAMSGSNNFAGNGSGESEPSSGDEDLMEEHGHYGDEDALGSEGEEGDAIEEDIPVAIKKRKTTGPESVAKLRKGIDDIPQDGVYTAEIYKSNLFKLQVDELLKQVKPRYGKKEVTNAMHALKSIIEQIPNREPQLVHDAEKSLLKSSKISTPFPYPRPPKDAKYKLEYEKPAGINVTGSYVLEIAAKHGDELSIDLVVTMPSSLFQEKDFLNYRYFYKRAYYLACIAAGIKDSKDHKLEIRFESLNGNSLQPILVVRPSKASIDAGGDLSASNFCINILLTPGEKVFSSEKLLPEKNCVRPKGSNDESSSRLVPTPFYNATLQADCSITAYLKVLHAASKQSDAYKDACILGRVWLRQRGFHGHVRKGGFGNFEWAAIMAILLRSSSGTGAPILSAGYSSYQLFKATIQFLATRDLTKIPFAFEAASIPLPKTEGMPYFFDGERSVNLLFKMTAWSYKMLRKEAKNTLKSLADSTFDQFDSTFILKVESPMYRYDSMLELPLTEFEQDTNHEDIRQTLPQICKKLYTTLTRGLGNRITSLSISLPEETGWQVSSSRPFEDRQGRILIGLETDPANSTRLVDHGPAAENKKEAASFRRFWGEKSELRRFKDGSILESLVWSQKDSSGTIVEQIIRHLVQRHFSAKVADSAKFLGDSFNRLITAGGLSGQSGTIPFLSLMTAFSTLEKDIRGLKNLPLQIRHILSADSQLRYSSIDPPFNASAQMKIPASIVVQFEGSGRWPDDLLAIQRTKIAFLLKLAELLSGENAQYITRVGLENTSQPSRNQSFLDIITPSGAAFRLRIHHDREAFLLDHQLKDKLLDGPTREATAHALAAYKRDFLRIPAHTQAMQTLCTRFTALSPAIRLTRKWFASHLLTSHFAPEFIELLVARSFLQPAPWTTPSCATTGFLRTLFWLSRWDWTHSPLIVDLANAESGADSMKADDVAAITTRFEAWRRIDRDLNRVVLFAASNLDPDGTTWTDRARPAKVVARRMTVLAQAAVSVLKDTELGLVAGTTGVVDFQPETLFAGPLSDYSFVLRIARPFTRFGRPKSDAKASNAMFKNLQLQMQSEDRDVETVGYAPVSLFVEELREVYGNTIIWFYDEEGGDVVAGLWNPMVTGKRGWKVRLGTSTVPVVGNSKPSKGNDDGGVDVMINKGGILNEITRLGGDLIEKTEVFDIQK